MVKTRLARFHPDAASAAESRLHPAKSRRWPVIRASSVGWSRSSHDPDVI
ncbi:hypothetical protein V5735_01935 (plasmid) [Haladaptatus sp. SPP-AMP-3]